MNLTEIPLIAIVGCQRSGTTLTGQILGAHSKAFLIDEFDGLYPFLKMYLNIEKYNEKLVNEVIESAASKYEDHRRFFRTLLDLEGFTIVAKAPNSTFDIDAMSSRADVIKVVFPIRDPRSVVSSILNLTDIPMIENQIKRINSVKNLFADQVSDLEELNSAKTSDATKATIIWKIKTGMYSRYINSKLETVVFKYEDLVQAPYQILKTLLQHCELEYEPAVIKYYDTLKGMGPGNTSRKSKITKDTLGKWKETLSEADILDIHNVVGKSSLFDQFNY